MGIFFAIFYSINKLLNVTTSLETKMTIVKNNEEVIFKIEIEI